MKRIVIPPYDHYNLSTFVTTGKTVHIGHFGGCQNCEGKLLTTIEEQMEQTLSNLNKDLNKINLDLNNVVKLTVILKNIKDFEGMHKIWMERFKPGNYPVRFVITSDFVDDNCLVQIEGTAFIR